mmetsp:Transcript_1542/g.3943  ORF Transcript_1542/g.3943 Transcript_1542/m.3943 type:complete len:265 (-) Transcript_1542:329-1123(-)
MGCLAVGRELRPAEERAHLLPGDTARLRAAAKGEAPLADHHGVPLQLPCVLLDCPEMLGEGAPMPLVLEAMIPVYLETNVLVACSSAGPPRACKIVHRALEDWEHHGHPGSHACTADSVHCTTVVAAQDTQRHLWRRLVADGDARHRKRPAVALGENAHRAQRLLEAPMPPPPLPQRPLVAPARSLGALASGAPVEVEQHLQAALFCPSDSTIHVLQRRAHIWILLPAAWTGPQGAEHHPVAKRQANCVQPHAADLLEVLQANE